MENDSHKKTEINSEFIRFELIQESLGLKNEILFKKYLQEVFVDLSTKKENTKTKYLSRLTFYDYVKLPIFISEKLFNSFAVSSQQEGLTEEEFINGFFKLHIFRLIVSVPNWWYIKVKKMEDITKGGKKYGSCVYELFIRSWSSFWASNKKMESKNGRVYFYFKR